MSSIIFDIETVGTSWESLDPLSQEYLKSTARSPGEGDRVAENLGFSPLTGQIVAIGILNPETTKGAVYYQAPDASHIEEMDKDVLYVTGSEADILRRFWDVVTHYTQFITFNGRAFDCPFLMVRSAVHRIRPSKNLVPYRYGDEHIDLFDRLGFFGAVRRTMNLHMWCQALGIKSPKENGITGHDVAQLFASGRFRDIASYCYDDLVATAKLYEIWQSYINIT